MTMKYLGGFIIGVVTTILVLLLIYAGSTSNETLSGLTIFPAKGECITKNGLEIFQTITPNMALAQIGKLPNEILVLLVNYEGKSYYDQQKIQIPANKCARQIGTYQYMTKMEIQKTVPVVVIE
jgi:hypothetical protein